MAMPTVRLALLAAGLIIAMTAESVNAQEATSSDQPPAGAFSQTPLGRVVSGLNPRNWKMPKMPTFQQVMPTTDERKAITQRKNNLVTEVSQTATKSWKRTKEVLNPKRLTTLFGPVNQTAKQSASEDVNQVGFFESLLRPMPPETPHTSSVNDFLKQKKPNSKLAFIKNS